MYILAQIVGALAAGEVALVSGLAHCSIDPLLHGSNPVTPTPVAGVSPGTVFLVEGLTSVLLIFVVFSTAVDPNGHPTITPLASGICCAAGVLVSSSSSGGSLNPLVYLAPSLVCGRWVFAWAYLLAPFTAALVAGPLYQYVFLLRRMDSIAGSAASFQRDDYDIINRFASVNIEDR